MNSRRKTGLGGFAAEVLGWMLVSAGIAALVLPGPGLLGIFAGLALLAMRYEWADRRLQPVKAAALQAAKDSVRSWPQIISSSLGALLLAAAGMLWGIHPAAPSWWPLADTLWLPGGWATGGTLIASAVIAGVTIGYSYLKFRN